MASPPWVSPLATAAPARDRRAGKWVRFVFVAVSRRTSEGHSLTPDTEAAPPLTFASEAAPVARDAPVTPFAAGAEHVAEGELTSARGWRAHDEHEQEESGQPGLGRLVTPAESGRDPSTTRRRRARLNDHSVFLARPSGEG